MNFERISRQRCDWRRGLARDPPCSSCSRSQTSPALSFFFCSSSAEFHHHSLPHISPPTIAIQLQLISFHSRQSHLSLYHVPERPPPVQPRRRRHLCHRQSRCSECTSTRPNRSQFHPNLAATALNRLSDHLQSSIELPGRFWSGRWSCWSSLGRLLGCSVVEATVFSVFRLTCFHLRLEMPHPQLSTLPPYNPAPTPPTPRHRRLRFLPFSSSEFAVSRRRLVSPRRAAFCLSGTLCGSYGTPEKEPSSHHNILAKFSTHDLHSCINQLEQSG